MMVPFEAVLIPVYLLFSNAHLHNTWWALIAPDIASPLALFLMTQFFQEIPPELDEAAHIDGASRFTVFFRIILPWPRRSSRRWPSSPSSGPGTSICSRSCRPQIATR